MRACIQCRATIKHEIWSCDACGWHPMSQDGLVCMAPEMLADHDGYHEPLFEEYEKLEATHFWFVHRRRLILDVLQSHFPTLRSFIDIGCGTAENLKAIEERFPHARICGGEASLQALTSARNKSNAQFIQMDARALPFTAAFDVIGAFDVIEHVDDDERVLAEMYRACRADGGLILTVPQHPSLWSHLDDAAMHKRRYTRKELLCKVRAAGFQPVYATSFMSLLLPAMALSRLQQRLNPPKDAVDDGFRIGATLNRIFGGICAAERQLILGGLRFPLGGSLLVAARKPS